MTTKRRLGRGALLLVSARCFGGVDGLPNMNEAGEQVIGTDRQRQIAATFARPRAGRLSHNQRELNPLSAINRSLWQMPEEPDAHAKDPQRPPRRSGRPGLRATSRRRLFATACSLLLISGCSAPDASTGSRDASRRSAPARAESTARPDSPGASPTCSILEATDDGTVLRVRYVLRWSNAFYAVMPDWWGPCFPMPNRAVTIYPVPFWAPDRRREYDISYNAETSETKLEYTFVFDRRDSNKRPLPLCYWLLDSGPLRYIGVVLAVVPKEVGFRLCAGREYCSALGSDLLPHLVLCRAGRENSKFNTAADTPQASTRTR